MIHEARNAECDGYTVRGRRGRGGRPPEEACLCSSWLRANHHVTAPRQVPVGMEQRGQLTWKAKQACRAFPPWVLRCSLTTMNSHCARGQLRPPEQLSADAQTLLPQQRRSPHPFGASLERSRADTKLAAVFFKWTMREPEIRTK